MQKVAKRRQLLVPVAGWVLQSERNRAGVDERVLPLLRGIAANGTLTAAADATGIPYRTAWGVLETASEALGTALVTFARGRGASLTPLARRWLALDDRTREGLEDRGLVVDLRDSASPTERASVVRMRIAASHDIALAQLKDPWRIRHGIALAFHGSAESLDAFGAGQVELAGFHVALGADRDQDPLLAKLVPARDALLRFLRREQGLIVPRGNPRRLRTLADLATRRLAIVNRQPASGTRLLFDRLLAQARVKPASLEGYGNEEFTHAAVAATVAAGRADAGFGIRAAAAQFGLDFLPLAVERYLFACRRRALDSARVEAFRALLASGATRSVVAPLPGYWLDGPGELVRPESVIVP